MIFAFYLLDKMDLFGAIKLERDKHVIQKLDESIVQSITSLNMIIDEIKRYLPATVWQDAGVGMQYLPAPD